MDKNEVKRIADTICQYATDVSWGFVIEAYWDGDVLVFRNAPEPAESWWSSMVDDICETCGLVCELTGMEYVDIDDGTRNVNDIEEFKCGLKFKED